MLSFSILKNKNKSYFALCCNNVSTHSVALAQTLNVFSKSYYKKENNSLQKKSSPLLFNTAKECFIHTKNILNFGIPLYYFFKRKPIRKPWQNKQLFEMRGHLFKQLRNARIQKSIDNGTSVSSFISERVGSQKWPYRKKTKTQMFAKWKAGRFYYRIVEPRKIKRRFKRWSFLEYSHNRVTKFRLYYTTSTQHQFNKLLRSFNTLKKNVMSHFVMQLEGRLEFFLYRINFAPTKYFARQLIRNKGISVNNTIITSRNFLLKPLDFVFVLENQFQNVVNFLENKIKSKKLILTNPHYTEVDYVVLGATFIKKPVSHDLMLPLSLENDFSNRKIHYIYNKI